MRDCGSACVYGYSQVLAIIWTRGAKCFGYCAARGKSQKMKSWTPQRGLRTKKTVLLSFSCHDVEGTQDLKRTMSLVGRHDVHRFSLGPHATLTVHRSRRTANSGPYVALDPIKANPCESS